MDYTGKPELFSARQAHRTGKIKFKKDGSILLDGKIEIPLARQKTSVERVTMGDVFEPLSRVSKPAVLDKNSELAGKFNESIKSLRLLVGSKLAKEVGSAGDNSIVGLFTEEYELYQLLLQRDFSEGKRETDYGNYLFDGLSGFLYKLAPEHIHRLALVTSNSHMLNNPKRTLSWVQVREIFDKSVIAVVGMSVGSNVMEGIIRDVRPGKIRIADFDNVAVTNLQRIERTTIFDTVESNLEKADFLDPYEIRRPSKAVSVARQWNLVDPYMEIEVFDAIDDTNREKFLDGVDIVWEEIDDMEEKVKMREAARKMKVMLAMMSDFGLMPTAEISDFSKYPNRSLALGATDKELKQALGKVYSGGRDELWDFVEKLVGPGFKKGTFGRFVLDGEGEQTTGGLPQLGGTAMAAGRYAALIVAWKLLGHRLPARFEDYFEEFKYFVEYDKAR